MGFNWEDILGAEGADIQDAYDDCVWRARMYEESRFDFSDRCATDSEYLYDDDIEDPAAEENLTNSSLAAYIRTGGNPDENCRQLTERFIHILEDKWKLESELPFPTAPDPDVQTELSALYRSFFRCALRILAEREESTFCDLLEMAGPEMPEACQDKAAEDFRQSWQAFQKQSFKSGYTSNFSFEVCAILQCFLEEENV